MHRLIVQDQESLDVMLIVLLFVFVVLEFQRPELKLRSCHQSRAQRGEPVPQCALRWVWNLFSVLLLNSMVFVMKQFDQVSLAGLAS